MVDEAAYEHDIAYFRAGVSGLAGALFSLDVLVVEADRKLANAALKAMRLYAKGGIDPTTGEKVSERTNFVAACVWRSFSAIERQKGVRNVVPNTLDNLRRGFNNFINSLNSEMSRMRK